MYPRYMTGRVSPGGDETSPSMTTIRLPSVSDDAQFHVQVPGCALHKRVICPRPRPFHVVPILFPGSGLKAFILKQVLLTQLKVESQVSHFLGHPIGVNKLSHLSLQLHHVVNCDPSALEVELDWRPSTLLDNSLTETIAQARGELVQHKWRLMSLDGRSQQLQHDKDLLE